MRTGLMRLMTGTQWQTVVSKVMNMRILIITQITVDTTKRICIYCCNIFSEYNQQDATFHSLFISVRRSTCFRRFLRSSSIAQNCTYSVRYLSEQYCYLTLYVQFWAPDDGRKNRLKHVERLTEINKLWNFYLFGCALRIYKRCTDLWMLNCCNTFRPS